MLTNIVLTLLRGSVGFFAGSTAVLVDAANSASDIVATVVVYVGLKLAGNPPDETHHYGHAKYESVAAKIVALLIMATGISLGVKSFLLIKTGNIEVPGTLAIWVTVLSIVAKECAYRYVGRAGQRLRSSVLLADAANHRSDVLASFAVLCGVLGAQLGYPALDPLAGLTVSLYITYTGLKIYAQSIRELIDEAPSLPVLNDITRIAEGTCGVLSVTEIKARLISSRVLVDLKICVNPFLTVAEGHHIATLAKRALLEELPIVESVLVHVNPCHHMAVVDQSIDCTTCKFHPHDMPEEETADEPTNTGAARRDGLRRNSQEK
ncbi:MAG: cation transporter [Firmicutes bacterium]|nr:cation transporter [Dethiobacter sp.]MBS3887887.1 cation transporter [Bacillota bacterium]MBS4053702.1 cation transporter [Thermaerobacter sp.]